MTQLSRGAIYHRILQLLTDNQQLYHFDKDVDSRHSEQYDDNTAKIRAWVKQLRDQERIGEVEWDEPA